METRSRDIAVIGLAGRFPGASDIDTFWENLVAKVDSVTDIPSDRWDGNLYYDEQPAKPLRTYCKKGGFLDAVDKFDNAFFNITEDEASLMDPKQRILLETAHAALDHAGYGVEKLSGTRTGVFIGSGYNYYEREMPVSKIITPHGILGISNPLLANRLSHFMNFHGPSCFIDTFCSSSLMAVHLACENLLNGECTTALAGGVHVLSFLHYICLSQFRALSRDGKCKTFDQSANGFVPGEGTGVVVLKRYEDALRDHDSIHAVIKGSSANHGGRTSNLASPNSKAQEEVIAKAYKNAGVDCRTVSYIEIHGTGTELGDPLEFIALKKVFGASSPRPDTCRLGSVKTNIGHLEPAAGIASLIKVILCMKHKKIPGMLHLSKLNRFIDLSGSPFRVNTETEEWISPDGPRRAGISAFGLSGSNIHMVVEEAVPVPAPARPQPESSSIFKISAKDKAALQQLIVDHKNYLERHPDLDFHDICYSASAGRDDYQYRIAIVSNNREGLMARLQTLAAGSSDISYSEDIFIGNATDGAKAVFVQYGEPVSTPAISETLVSLGIKPAHVVAGGGAEIVSQRFSNQIHLDAPVTLDQFRLTVPKEPDTVIIHIHENGSDPTSYQAAAKDGAKREFELISSSDTLWKDITRCISLLYVKGGSINWEALNQRCEGKRVPLVAYPLSRKKFWFGPVNATPFEKEAIAPVPVSETNIFATKVSLSENIESTITSSVEEQQNLIMEELAGIVAKRTNIDRKLLTADADFNELGIDSLMRVEIAHEVIGRFPELEKAGDRIMNSNSLSGMRLLLSKLMKAETAITSLRESPAAGPWQIEDLYTQQKRTAENLTCSSVKVSSIYPSKVTARLKIDERHPFFFDHPLDHVSGIQLTEALLQTVHCAYLYKMRLNPDNALFCSNIQIKFHELCPKDRSPAIEIEELDFQESNEFRSFFKGQIRSETKFHCSGSFSVSTLNEDEASGPAYDAEDVSAGHAEVKPCKKEHANKQDIANVFITEPFNLESEGTSPVFRLIPVGSHRFFSDYAGPHIPTLYLLEAFRQTQRFLYYTREQRAETPDVRRGFLLSLGISLKRPIHRNETVHLHAADVTPAYVGSNMLVTTKGHVTVGETEVGICTVKNLILSTAPAPKTSVIVST